MKPLYLLIVSLACASNLYSQKEDFEGTITFVRSFKSKNDMTNDELRLFFGDTVLVTIKKGNYKQKCPNANGITDVIYRSKENRYYMKYKDVDTLYFYDGLKDTSKILSITIDSVNRKNILGFECNSLTMNFSKRTITYYYSPIFYKNPDNFTNHILFHYDTYISQSQAIHLQSIVDDEFYFVQSTAIDIKKRSINDDSFELPALPIVQK
jgi:hypothetical protein